MRMPSLVSFVCFSVLALPACGGSNPPPAEPSSAKTDSAEPAKDEAKSDETKPAEAKSDESKPEEKPAESSGPEVKRTAKDIITAPEVTFMFDFNESEAKDKAEKACSPQAGDDAKKMALCMKKASSKFPAEGMQFKQDKGEWVWITLQRKGSAITILHHVPIDFSDDKPNSVVIKATGKDTGKQAMHKLPSQVTIEVPNEFSIALDDPTNGRMVYEAKIGIMSNEQAK